MGKALELTGQKFGLLTVIKRKENDKWRNSQWLCQCDCGNIIKVGGANLKIGRTKSCGCLWNKSIMGTKSKHGYSYSKIYQVWKNMKGRCLNPYSPLWKYYGSRGITVCERWVCSFENFLEDMGEQPEGLTLDRKDNNGNYEPSNCRWTTHTEQMRNSRQAKLNIQKVKKIKKLLKQSTFTNTKIAQLFNVNKSTISNIKTKKVWISI